MRETLYCPNCRILVLVANFYDLHYQIRNERHILKVNRQDETGAYVRHYINKSSKKSTKRDVYNLLDLKSILKRRILSSTNTQHKLSVLEGCFQENKKPINKCDVREAERIFNFKNLSTERILNDFPNQGLARKYPPDCNQDSKLEWRFVLTVSFKHIELD